MRFQVGSDLSEDIARGECLHSATVDLPGPPQSFSATSQTHATRHISKLHLQQFRRIESITTNDNSHHPTIFLPGLANPTTPTALSRLRRPTITMVFSTLSWLPSRASFLSTTVPTTVTQPSSILTRAFSTTGLMEAKKKKATAPVSKKQTGGRKKKRQVIRSEFYARVKILRQNLFAPAPPPLRMARLRHLRHWTIHRAWLLFRRQQREGMEKERMRMHAGMYNACEELRNSVGPGDKSEGYLYRVAMEKKGVWGLDGVPIEYARLQADYPAETPWNHDWKR